MVRELLHARSGMMIMFAIFAISAGLTLGLAREALANYSFSRSAGCCGNAFNPDSNGYVPEFEGKPDNSSRDLILGRTYFYYDRGTQAYIRYDNDEMHRCNADRYDFLTLYAHERAHSRGWGHYEDPISRNAAWNPVLPGVVCP